MNWDSTRRIIYYILITSVISIISQLDSMGFEFSKLTIGLCVSMLLKSLLPGLVAVKALFDDNLINNKPSTTTNS